MSPEQLALQLTEAKDASVQIMGKPSHEDIVCIRELLTPLLLQAGYNKSHVKHKLWGIIAPASAYAVNYSEPFATSECIGAYPLISQDAIDQNRKLEAVWKICIKNYVLYDTGIRGAAAFILSIVDDVWVCKMRDTTTFYTDVLPSDFLTHLKEHCTGIYAIDSVDLPLIIQG